MFSHGVMTALVFLMIGALYDQAHTRDLKDFGGIAKVMPVWVIFYAHRRPRERRPARALGLHGGVPHLRRHVPHVPARSGGLAIFAAALAAAYMLRMFRSGLLRSVQPALVGPQGADAARARLGRAAHRLHASLMGVWWAPFTDRIGATVTLLPGVTG